jgi:hypothetical protein
VKILAKLSTLSMLKAGASPLRWLTWMSEVGSLASRCGMGAAVGMPVVGCCLPCNAWKPWTSADSSSASIG